jgi:hypothetical protein
MSAAERGEAERFREEVAFSQAALSVELRVAERRGKKEPRRMTRDGRRTD